MNIFKLFGANGSGNVTVIAAIAIVPLLLAAGSAIDYVGASRLETALQSAVDAAALAGAASPSEQNSEKTLSTEKFFQSAAEFKNLAPTITIDEDRVTVAAAAAYPTSFMKLSGFDSIAVAATATADPITKPICLLALDNTSSGAINVWGSTASITAAGCVVHSNSTNASALKSSSGEISTAEAFCAVGGYSGTEFDPQPRSICRPAKDPYAALPVPSVSGCDYNNTTIGSGTENLTPGIYCGGLTIGGGTVNFAPGLYVMKDGELKISGSTAGITGVGVTFYFYGNQAALTITGGGTIELSAPASGPYDGLLFVQNPDYGAGKTSKLNGSSSTKIVGTGYFPSQTLSVGGNGKFGISSPYMAFVAKTLEFHGNGQIIMNYDAKAAGFNSAQPREYWGTRLID